MKIVTIVGARPQFIKYSCLYNDLRKEYDEILVHTGQHYDYEMSKIFFDQLHIPAPNYNLNIHENTHGRQTLKIISKYNVNIGKNIKIIKPLGYIDFLSLEKNAKKIITDSGFSFNNIVFY
ncbi:unnamed protein product, partial [marine sediment metagenome]